MLRKAFIIIVFSFFPCLVVAGPAPMLLCDSSYYVSCNAGYALINNDCVPCTGCDAGCVDDIDWLLVLPDPQYEKRTTRTCNCNGCKEFTQYRCAGGYYGISIGPPMPCNPCPVGGTSVAGDNATIDRCYAQPPSGNDASGGWLYTNTCYYSG